MVESSTRKFGISTWVYPELAAQQALRRLGSQGISVVEYAFRNLALASRGRLRSDYAGGKGAWALERASIPASSIAETADCMGVRPVQMHAPQFDLADPDRGLRRRAVEKTDISIRICGDLRVPRLIVHPGIGDLRLSGEAGYLERVRDATVKSLRSLLPTAVDSGVVLCVENAGHSPHCSAAGQMLALLAELGSDSIGTCLDTGHAIKNGFQPAKMARDLGRLLTTTHLHDNDGSSDQHLPPYSGRVNWERLASALASISYRGPLIAEVAGSPDLRLCGNRIALTRLGMGRFLGLLGP